VTLTNVDHCHGPHSADCHEQKSETSRQHDESSGDREDHEQIVQELKMRSVETIQIPVVIPQLLTWLPAAVGTMEEWGRNANCQSVIERDPAAAPGVVVARTVVFII
jgi:hypothetical protein